MTNTVEARWFPALGRFIRCWRDGQWRFLEPWELAAVNSTVRRQADDNARQMHPLTPGSTPRPTNPPSGAGTTLNHNHKENP
jgi:hypothetical protein